MRFMMLVKASEESEAGVLPFEEGEIEIRQVFETEEFAPSDPTGELRAQEERLRARVEAQRSS